jgi:hypothetical protein
MIQLHEPLDIQTLHKTLPKKLSHVKEHAKVMFIQRAIHCYRNNDDFGTIDFFASKYNGKTVSIVYSPSTNTSLAKIAHDILEKWYFGNLEKNENVYFYRFVNVFRAELTDNEWNDVYNILINSDNLSLRENFKQYVDYRKKLDEIDVILSKENFTAKELY